MEPERYIKCSNCAGVFNYNDRHPSTCNFPNLEITFKDGINICCWTCGREDVEYSEKELEKKEQARCTRCESNCRMQKFKQFEHLYSYHTDQVHKLEIDRQLQFYVREGNLIKVKKLLEKGANPNYIFNQATFSADGCWYVLWYNADGSINTEPTHPALRETMLSICIGNFRYGDYENDFIREFQIAKLLVEYGANTNDELQVYEKLCGKYEEGDGIRYDFYSLLQK